MQPTEAGEPEHQLELAIERTMSKSPPFERVDGVERYRGVPVERRTVTVAGLEYQVACLRDAADLLDEPDYAERFLEEDRAPYGMELWPASLMLAEYILQHEPGDGRPAIELGCGLGLVAIVAARHGWRACATDCDPTALRFAEYNAACNGADVSSFEILDWHKPGESPRYDRVFAADVLYQRKDHEAVLRCIARLLRADGVALLSDPNRGVADGFEAMAAGRGFTVEVEATTAMGIRDTPVGGRLFRLQYTTHVQ